MAKNVVSIVNSRMGDSIAAAIRAAGVPVQIRRVSKAGKLWWNDTYCNGPYMQDDICDRVNKVALGVVAQPCA